jgi:hypothetical protein
MSNHPNSRAATAARSHIIELLQEDHWRVKRAYREFQRLDADRNGDLCESIIRRTLHDLRVHAQLEEELIYPVMRPIVTDPERVDEAEVEHETMRLLISQLEAGQAADDKFSARFVVLCEYVLKRAKLDWETLCAEFTERREALQAADAYDSLPGSHEEPPVDEHGLLMTGRYPERYPPYEAGTITSRKI